VRDLPERMDPCVGPARAHHIDRVLRDGRNRRLHPILDTAAVDLRLPSGVAGAVVGDAQCDSPHPLPGGDSGSIRGPIAVPAPCEEPVPSFDPELCEDAGAVDPRPSTKSSLGKG